MNVLGITGRAEGEDERLQMGKGCECGNPLVREAELVELERLKVFESGQRLEVGVGDGGAVGERKLLLPRPARFLQPGRGSVKEIVSALRIRCRRSKDACKAWSSLEVIAEDTSGNGTYDAPAQWLSHGGVLHTFVGKMKGHDLITNCAFFVLDQATHRWEPRGNSADLF